MPDLFSLTLEPSKDLLTREVGGETVFLNLDGDSYFGLNAVGTRVWQLLVAHGSPERAVEIMLQEYEVEESILREDVELLVRAFLDAGLMLQLDESSS